jgi:DNA repair ATPase RecN
VTEPRATEGAYQGTGAELAALCRELERLAEEASARLGDGDENTLDQYCSNREALVARIAPLPRRLSDAGGRAADAAAHRRDAAGALRRVVDLDRDLLTRLEASRAEIHRELSRLSESRRFLASYRGSPKEVSQYVERLS